MKKQKISKKIWTHMNKTMPVQYMVLYFALGLIILEGIIIGNLSYKKRYLYGLGEDEKFMTAISTKCYEKKNEGKVCLVEKKVMWYERTDIENRKK